MLTSCVLVIGLASPPPPKAWRRFRTWQQRRGVLRAAELVRLDAVSTSLTQGRIGKDERAMIEGLAGKGSGLYGEITPKGFSGLGKRMRLGPLDSFADCGSGSGAAVLQAVSEFDVLHACGVELSPTRHACALRSLSESDVAAARTTFVLGDFAAPSEWAAGGALSEPTAVWACSTVFSKALMRQLAQQLSTSRDVRIVASLKRFSGGLPGFTEQRPPEQCEMSWTALQTHPGAPDVYDPMPGMPVYIYEQDTDRRPPEKLGSAQVPVSSKFMYPRLLRGERPNHLE